MKENIIVGIAVGFTLLSTFALAAIVLGLLVKGAVAVWASIL